MWFRRVALDNSVKTLFDRVVQKHSDTTAPASLDRLQKQQQNEQQTQEAMNSNTKSNIYSVHTWGSDMPFTVKCSNFDWFRLKNSFCFSSCLLDDLRTPQRHQNSSAGCSAMQHLCAVLSKFAMRARIISWRSYSRNIFLESSPESASSSMCAVREKSSKLRDRQAS